LSLSFGANDTSVITLGNSTISNNTTTNNIGLEQTSFAFIHLLCMLLIVIYLVIEIAMQFGRKLTR